MVRRLGAIHRSRGVVVSRGSNIPSSAAETMMDFTTVGILYMFKFGNGQPVRGSGIEGIVIGRADYANGTRKYLVRARYEQHGDEPAQRWVDETELEDATPASFEAQEPPIS